MPVFHKVPLVSSLIAAQPQARSILLMVPFHFTVMEGTALLGTVNAAGFFLYCSPDLCLNTIPA